MKIEIFKKFYLLEVEIIDKINNENSKSRPPERVNK